MFWLLVSCVLFLFALRFRFPYFITDVQYGYRILLVAYHATKIRKSKPFHTLLDRFQEHVQKHPDKAFIRFGDETYTYAETDRRSNKIARCLLKHADLHAGDSVALLVGNEPMFMWIWLALTKIGCSAALLNYNIRSRSLLHCFSCSGAKALIASTELQDAVEEVLPALREQGVTVYILTDSVNCVGTESLTDKINQASDEPIPADLRANITLKSVAVYIYTSGTTGLPKAGLVTHQRLWAMSLFQLLCGVTSEDVLYINLPLYHSAGFCIGFGGCIERGSSIVLKSKFSSSQFWDDCRKYNVTLIQYIGETMRYLCNTPKRFSDPVHNVRMAIGNGMRADIWRTFISRFGHIEIKEFYGATEGITGFLNFPGKIGAVGRLHAVHKKVSPFAIVKFDQERGEPVRNADGFCTEVTKGETGLLLSKITQTHPFIGYAGDQKQTEKTKLYHVFEKGDVYFNSGDLFRIDNDSFVYFQDRVGDTFRWKGENVSTNEVLDILTMVTCIEQANVYGVTVPGHEGRIGMAAVKLKDDQQFDCECFFSHVTTYLPSYARPRFIRIKNEIDTTGTYKYMKAKLTEEGFNPAGIKEPLFVLDETMKRYRPLTQETYESILEGHFRL
ncbi:very long-chain acyl-CoA synthetase [Triplophysa dalaica]|uniref:very long-chain acyl-CoA synthetase n=1 Tax=Triplophysa dalaica TaxID=1582913 RepID=UPI0024E007A6|nr:very long-chain acyl-CoA synthetase [Triplophysa dalaica]